MLPVPAVSVSAWAPVTVATVIFPAPLPLFKVASPVSVIGLVKVIALLIVVIVPWRLTDPAPPFCWKDPEMEVLTGETRVTVPLLTMTKEPPFVVTIAPFLEKLLRVRLIPPAPFVFNVPVKVVVPVPADWTMLAAVIPCVDTLLALVKVSVPRRVIPPTSSEIVMLPPPAAKVRLFPPSTVASRLILAEAAAVLSVALAATVIGPAMEIVLPAVICPPNETLPVPV